MLKNRPLSFAIITIIYILAGVVGVLTYQNLAMDFWLKLLIADVLATVFVFIFSVIFKNASVYDPYWSVQPIVIIGAFAVKNGFNLISLLLFLAVCLWGIRLTANWAYTFQNLEWQDWRYTMLHDKTGFFYPVINFIGIHMVPTLVVYMVTLPVVWVQEHQPDFNPLSLLFILISVSAVIIQGTSDYQMHSYRRNRNGAFIRNGLWKHGRHPNYFGEIMMWWGIGGAVVSVMPENYWLLAGALLNTALFFFVSIPLADGRQKRKPGFDEYKKETRILI